MHWEVEKNEETIPTPDSVVDLSFSIRCKTLPVDNAWLLFRAISQVLPWLKDDPVAGIHPLHVAESAHGWQRPEEPDALLHLSRRTKLVLRLPRERVAQARELEEKLLNIDGHTMVVGEAEEQPLSRSTSLFSRHVVIHEEETEERFMQRVLDEMAALGIRPKKLLPGLSHTLRTGIGEEIICTRLLSLEGLQLEEAFRLQERGLGEYRHLGCGIFIPHKPLAKVQI
jgi:CRISPR-associated protein Cas6